MRSPLGALYSWLGQAMHNRIVAVVLAMVVVILLVAVPTDRVATGTSLLVLETFALVLAVMLLWRERWDMSRTSISTFLRTGSNLPVLILMAIGFISYCMSSAHRPFATQGLLQLGAGVLLYFVVGYQFRQSKHLFMFVDTLLFLAAIVSLSTMINYEMSGGEHASPLFGNQQPLGSLLMVFLPIVTILALSGKRDSRQLVAQVVTVMTAGGLLLAKTRSGWFGALAGLAVLAVLVYAVAAADRKGKTPKKLVLATNKHRLVLPLVMSVMCLGFVGLLITQNSSFVSRLTDGGMGKSFQNRREKWWGGAVRAIKERPLTGVGINQWPLYQYDYTGQGFPVSETGYKPTLGSQVHNFYLQLAAELGIPGLLAFIAILGAFFSAAARRLQGMDAGIRRTLLMGCVGSVVGFSIDALSSPSWQYGQVVIYLWLILGAALACLRPRNRPEDTAVSPRAEAREGSGRRMEKRSVPN